MSKSILTYLRLLRLKNQTLKRFFRSDKGKIIAKIFKFSFQAGIVLFLLYQLTNIGWGVFFRSLPTEPLFYLLFLFIYFLLPFSEALAYKLCWDIPYLKSVAIFIKKRIFNKDVMGYSGEVVLLQWAVSEKAISKKKAFKDIRDMNIISSAASTMVALGLLVILLFTGQIRALDYLFNSDALSGLSFLDYAIGFAIAIILIGVLYRFRKYLFSMPFGMSSKIFAIHSARMVILYAAQILQWYIVLPNVALDIWFTFLSVNIVISRIPFIPSQELVATGTNIEVAKVINAPVAAVSGLFLVHDFLGKFLNLFFYVYYNSKGKV